MSSPNRSAGQPDRRSIWDPAYRSATVGLFGLAFMVAYSEAAITTVMPQAANHLHGIALYGLAFAVTSATSVVSMTIAAIWIGRDGPKKPLLTGVAIYATGLLLAAGAANMDMLVAARAIQGLGTGLDGVALYVMVARVFPAHLRPQMFGALASAWVLPSIIGPALSGAVTEAFGWRWVFLTVPVLALAATAVVHRGTRHIDWGVHVSPPPLAVAPVHSAQGPDALGQNNDDGPAAAGIPPAADPGTFSAQMPSPIPSPSPAPAPVLASASVTPEPLPRISWRKPLWATAAALAVLALGNATAGANPWWVPELGAAVVVLALAVWKLLPHGTWLARPGLPALVLMRGLVGTAFTVGDVYLPLLMIDQRHLPAWMAGLSLTVSGVTWSYGSWLAGRGKIAPSKCLQWGAAGVVAGILIASLVLMPAMPVWVAWIGWTVGGLGIGLCYPTQSVLVLEKSEPHEQGENSSSLQLSETLATSATLGVVGALFATLVAVGHDGYVVAFAAACLLGLAALAVARRV